MEEIALTKTQERKQDLTEARMLFDAAGITRRVTIKNENVRKIFPRKCKLQDKLGKSQWWRFGYVQRREDRYRVNKVETKMRIGKRI